jgi:hypothetical protein
MNSVSERPTALALKFIGSRVPLQPIDQSGARRVSQRCTQLLKQRPCAFFTRTGVIVTIEEQTLFSEYQARS